MDTLGIFNPKNIRLLAARVYYNYLCNRNSYSYKKIPKKIPKNFEENCKELWFIYGYRCLLCTNISYDGKEIRAICTICEQNNIYRN